MLFPAAIIISQLLASACARQVNVTIDDTRGDQRSGRVPQYASAHAWNAGSPDNQCPACGARPDVTKAFDETWHDDTTFPGQIPSNVTFSFNGSAIYIFFILANNIDVAHKDTRLAFYLDGASKPIHQFLHEPDLTVDGLLYNQLVFHSVVLPTGAHSLLISSWADGDSGSIALFDYAIYSTTDDDPSTVTTTTTHPGTSPTRSTTSSRVPSSSGSGVSGQVPAPSHPVTSPIPSSSSDVSIPSSSGPGQAPAPSSPSPTGINSSSPTVGGGPPSAPTSPINAGAVVGRGSVAGAAVAIVTVFLPMWLLF